jgi:hypothetical protein
MGVFVPTDPADLDKIRSQVADNRQLFWVCSQVATNYLYHTGKLKANRKKLRRRGCKFKDDVDDNNNSTSLKKTTTANVTASTKSEELRVVIDGADHNDCGLQHLQTMIAGVKTTR